MKEVHIQELIEKIELLEFKQDLLLDLLKESNGFRSSRRNDNQSTLKEICIQENLNRTQYDQLKKLTDHIREELKDLDIRTATWLGRARLSRISKDEVNLLTKPMLFEDRLRDIITEFSNNELPKQIAEAGGFYDYLYGDLSTQLKELRDHYDQEDQNSKSHVEIEEEVSKEDESQIDQSNEKDNKLREYEDQVTFDDIVKGLEGLQYEFNDNYLNALEIRDTFKSNNLSSISKFYNKELNGVLDEHEAISSIKTTRDAIFNNKFVLKQYDIVDEINHSDENDYDFNEQIKLLFETKDGDHATNISYVVETYRLMNDFNSMHQLSISDCERLIKRIERCNELLKEVEYNYRQL